MARQALCVVALALAIGTAARGHGGAFPLGTSGHGEARVVRERALIAEEADRTTLILEAEIVGPPGDVAWVFSLPASPTEIVADQRPSDDLFQRLDMMARPYRADRRDPLLGARFVVLGLTAFLAMAAPFRLRSQVPWRRLCRLGLEAALVLAGGFGGIYLAERPPPPPDPELAKSAPAQDNVPQTLRYGDIGVSIVNSGPELATWFRKHGVFMPPSLNGYVESLTEDGSRCAVLRRTVGNGGRQATGLVAFRFARKGLRFSFGDGKTPPSDLELNVIGPGRATVEGLRERACVEVARPLESPVSGKAFTGWVTRLRGPAPSGETRLLWSSPRPFRATIYDRPSRSEGVVLVAGFLILATAWAIAARAVVRGAQGRRTLLAEVGAMALVAGVGLILFPVFVEARSGSGRVRSTWPRVVFQEEGVQRP